MANFETPSNTRDYQCECGATYYTPAFNCCDNCILVFFLDDLSAPIYSSEVI